MFDTVCEHHFGFYGLSDKSKFDMVRTMHCEHASHMVDLFWVCALKVNFYSHGNWNGMHLEAYKGAKGIAL